MLTTRPRGTNDITPDEVRMWQHIEACFRKICREYGYTEMRTPVFEHTELFNRSVGDTTDIIEKEMYTFLDRSGRSISLRPEGTVPVARAYLENNLHTGAQPVKLYYIGPMFRYDRPQAGRYRQFHQLGVEVFGCAKPAIDAEVIAMTMDFTRLLNLDLELHINSVGCDSCRPVLRQKLKEYFGARRQELCQDCLRRLEQNPLRVLDCKNLRCRELGQEAPTTLDCLCAGCADHFQELQRYLRALEVSFIIDRHLVRGLDYYTKTAFELIAPQIGAQSSAGGGGRYDNLIATVGGPPTPGIGYAFGLERLLLAMRNNNPALSGKERLDVFLATAGEGLEEKALKLLQVLRRKGMAADKDYLSRSLKAQMKFAGKIGVPAVAILGEKELEKGIVILKEMATGQQNEVSIEELPKEIFKLLTKGSTD
jgi:histidyl-tRNA synthetase